MNEKAASQALGREGEAAAARYLEQHGLRVEARHFQTRWGEIDLICRDRDTWVFVEVKSRTRATQPSAVDAVTDLKQKKLVRAALGFLKKRRLIEVEMRFDVVTMEADRIDWIAGAFEPPEDYSY